MKLLPGFFGLHPPLTLFRAATLIRRGRLFCGGFFFICHEVRFRRVQEKRIPFIIFRVTDDGTVGIRPAGIVFPWKVRCIAVLFRDSLRDAVCLVGVKQRGRPDIKGHVPEEGGVSVPHMVNENITEEQARAYMKQLLPTLDYWKRFDELGDNGEFEAFKQQLIGEINALAIEGMPKVETLNALVGSYVNLAYRLPSGMTAKFLDDQTTYLGNQLESEFGGDRCFGVLANMEFILVCTYGRDGTDPELVLYKKR